MLWDYTLLPKHSRNMAVLVDHTVMPWIPPVSFAEREDLRVKPTAEEIRAKGLDAPDIRRPASTDCPCRMRHESRLLALPLELRLSIYSWVFLATPVHHAQLAPWYPVPYQKRYIAGAVTETKKEKTEEGDKDKRESRRLLPSDKPLCGVPTSLLRVNREIYHEVRTMPFVYNEFVFVNWFSSGIWAARSFIRFLRPWQLSNLRQLRLEVLSRDLMGSGSRELTHVCSSLGGGLRGLRLKIAPGGSSLGLSWLRENAESWTGDVSEGRIGWGWAEEAIARLTGLERLEVELDVPKWEARDKLEWCGKLEGVLRRKGLRTVEVVCTEQILEERRRSAEALLEEMAM